MSFQLTRGKNFAIRIGIFQNGLAFAVAQPKQKARLALSGKRFEESV